jgi:hypothetical protein
MKRFRRNAEYASDSLAFKPIDRNQRIKVMAAADALELRTKGKGCKSGVLKQSGLRVLRCLLFDFTSIPSGRCCPSYKAIRERTGYCPATIAGALHRLEVSGLLRITRRIIRTAAGARQTSNAYRFNELGQGERKPDSTYSKGTINLLKNKGMQPQLPGLVHIGSIFNMHQKFASKKATDNLHCGSRRGYAWFHT